jgi:hypothetical protein
MSSTPSVNAGLASLLQNLSNINSPILSSPKAVAALQNAPPADIVQLSDEAIQLEGLNALFGAAEASGSAQAGSLLSSLLDGGGGGSPVTSPAGEAALQNATPGDIVQLSAEATQQAALTQLFE